MGEGFAQFFNWKHYGNYGRFVQGNQNIDEKITHF